MWCKEEVEPEGRNASWCQTYSPNPAFSRREWRTAARQWLLTLILSISESLPNERVNERGDCLYCKRMPLPSCRSLMGWEALADSSPQELLQNSMAWPVMGMWGEASSLLPSKTNNDTCPGSLCRLWSPGPPARSVVLCIPWPAAHTTACGTGMGVLPCTLDQQVFQIWLK